MQHLTMMAIGFWMLLAHLLYDFHWQGVSIGENKSKYKSILGLHSLTWALIVYAPIFIYTGVLSLDFISFLFVTHFFTDAWKGMYPTEDQYFWTLYVDQVIHLVSMLVILYLCTV